MQAVLIITYDIVYQAEKVNVPLAFKFVDKLSVSQLFGYDS